MTFDISKIFLYKKYRLLFGKYVRRRLLDVKYQELVECFDCAHGYFGRKRSEREALETGDTEYVRFQSLAFREFISEIVTDTQGQQWESLYDEIRCDRLERFFVFFIFCRNHQF